MLPSRMRHAMIVALVCLLPACGGGSSPTAPSPQPAQPTHIAGTITDTMTGAAVGTFSAEAMLFPAKVTVSAAGYVTRETWVRSSSPTVDLIAEAGFDVGFYRQFARGTLENAMQPLRVLNQAPSIYLQTAGLSSATVAAMEARARDLIVAMSGGKFTVQAIEEGPDARSPRSGWITVTLIRDATVPWCGQTAIGAAAGDVTLNPGQPACTRPLQDVLAHELGHAMGFWHTTGAGDIMNQQRPLAHPGIPSDLERRHAALAYHRSAGNMDVDVDVQAPSALRAVVVE